MNLKQILWSDTSNQKSGGLLFFILEAIFDACQYILKLRNVFYYNLRSLGKIILCTNAKHTYISYSLKSWIKRRYDNLIMCFWLERVVSDFENSTCNNSSTVSIKIETTWGLPAENLDPVIEV